MAATPSPGVDLQVLGAWNFAEMGCEQATKN
jgi:hypothetical protein